MLEETKKIKETKDFEIEEVGRVDGGIWKKRWEKVCIERDNFARLLKIEK